MHKVFISKMLIPKCHDNLYKVSVIHKITFVTKKVVHFKCMNTYRIYYTEYLLKRRNTVLKTMNCKFVSFLFRVFIPSPQYLRKGPLLLLGRQSAGVHHTTGTRYDKRN